MTGTAPTQQHEATVYAEVRGVLNKHDPERLLAIGAPPDAYDAEAAPLSALVRTGRPVTRALVLELWEGWWGPESWLATRAEPERATGIATGLDALARRFRDPTLTPLTP